MAQGYFEDILYISPFVHHILTFDYSDGEEN